jgi:uncharacterized membrane protein YbhN (UPF0104 family)
MKKQFKLGLAILILLATVGAFIHYIQGHPAVFDKLQQTNPWLMIIIVVGYLLFFAMLVIQLRLSIRIYGKTMSRQENILLNAYSTLINFFGPGQSGPALRGLYLKRRHGLPIKSYIFASLLYFGFYAVISAFFLFAGSQSWWKTLSLMAVAAGGSLVVIKWYARRSKISGGLNLKLVGWLGVATLLQLIFQAAIFYLELRQVMPQVSLGQALAYTGAANFSLFVALTPGAIGIREAFLVFSQSLHHISNTTIVAASVIDRAMYLVYLGVLFIVVLSLHAQKTLRFKYYTASKTADSEQSE